MSHKTRHLTQTADPARQQLTDLRADLRLSQELLREAEAELAAEQAAVNAFRMHARLMLDDLVDEVVALLAAREAAVMRLQLLQQDLDPALLHEPHPLESAHGAASEPDAERDPVEAILPTATPNDKAAEQRLYRQLARKFHPDLAETAVEVAYRTSMMSAVNAAYAAGDLGALYDLAGELAPEEVARLAAIESVEQRRVQELIVRCHRRRRKVQRQLQVLRQENTARLWRKAQELRDGDNWWASVRRDLEAARTRLRQDVVGLQAQIELLEPVEIPQED